jgi:hypothetical protein
MRIRQIIHPTVYSYFNLPSLSRPVLRKWHNLFFAPKSQFEIHWDRRLFKVILDNHRENRESRNRSWDNRASINSPDASIMNWFESAEMLLVRWKKSSGRSAMTLDLTQALERARSEAVRRKHNFVGGEHLLMGLLELESGIAVNVLTRLGLTRIAVRAQLDEHCSLDAETGVFAMIPYTPRAKRLLAAARAEARALGALRVDTGHLLLGFLPEEKGMVAEVFGHFHVNVANMRAEILKEMTSVVPDSNDQNPDAENLTCQIAQGPAAGTCIFLSTPSGTSLCSPPSETDRSAGHPAIYSTLSREDLYSRD